MGILNQVVGLLVDNGFRAERAYPAGYMPAITDVVAAVQLEKLSQSAGTVTVLVNVLAPDALGAEACEDAAIVICQLLRENGAVCTIGTSEFDQNMELFCIPVSAVFTGQETKEGWTASEEPEFWVTVEGVRRRYVVSFELWRERSETEATEETEATVTPVGDAGWSFRLEEKLAPGEAVETLPEEPFVIRVCNGGKIERCLSCILTSQRRELTKDGQLQILEGTSAVMDTI